jgi:hypothetical protein
MRANARRFLRRPVRTLDRHASGLPSPSSSPFRSVLAFFSNALRSTRGIPASMPPWITTRDPRIGRKRNETGVEWRDVLRVLSSDETRAAVLARYRAAGFTPDDFATSGLARDAMADALTRAEDVLELQAGSVRAAMRAAIRAVRRRLERA